MSDLAVLGVVEERSERRRRRGPVVTERDVVALRWVGEQYGARLDVLGVLLGRLGEVGEPLSLWAVRDQVTRWERLGFARPEMMPGGWWVTLTRRGLDVSDLEELRTTRLRLRTARHRHAINAVRLDYEADPVRAEMAPWVSERLTWRERGESDWHVPDGVIKVSGPAGVRQAIAVEVELKRKSREEYRDEVFGKLRRGSHPVREVRYFVPGERFRGTLAGMIAGALDQRTVPARWSVHLLPEVPGVTYLRGGAGRG